MEEGHQADGDMCLHKRVISELGVSQMNRTEGQQPGPGQASWCSGRTGQHLEGVPMLGKNAA